MNVPNKLTLSRFVLTLVFLLAMFSELPYAESMALVLFGAASLTDYYDGKIARRDKLITNFGILMDPLADKILVCSAFIAFVGRGWVPSWVAIIIVARELIITGLRLLAASKNLVLSAEGFGKLKTIIQITAILSILVHRSYGQWGAAGDLVFGVPRGHAWVNYFTPFALYVAVFLTFYSGALYLWRNRSLYLSDL